MELRALAQALRQDGAAAKDSARDALLFRAVRRSLHPGAHEISLEIQEGLAEYTGTTIALKASGESIARVARSTESFEDQTSFSRSFAYATGPALGLLLDRYAGAWRKNLKRDSDLALMLGEAVGMKLPPNLLDQARLRAQRYGFRAISEDEHSREVRTQARASAFRARFLDGPTLRFPKSPGMRRVFNPSNLVTLGEHGTVYPTGTFSGRWGPSRLGTSAVC